MKAEIIIDADRESVWRAFENPDTLSQWQPALTVTEWGKPGFIAGVHESARSKAIVVYHFEVLDENSTQVVVYAKHEFTGLRKLSSIFLRQAILHRTNEDLQCCKLLIETEAAGSAR
ncbi:MAG: SRPBCC family protein [Gammaproteobacteria bacterium]|nr:SRPBCC family protein [Gammaproteobacteria bacterium]